MVRALLEVRRRGKHPAAIVWSPLNKRRYHRGPGSPGLHTAARGAAASGRLPRSDSKRVSSTMNESPPPPLPHTHAHRSKIFCLSLPALRSYLFVPSRTRPPPPPLYLSFGKFGYVERVPERRTICPFLGKLFLSSVTRPFENSAKFRDRGKLFLSYFIPLFEHFLRNLEINAKNLSQKLFLSDSRTMFLIPIFVYLLENFARKKDYWRRTCREIRNWDNYHLNEEEVFFVSGKKDSDDESL